MQEGKSRLPSFEEYDEVKRHYPILYDNSPDMLAVKAYASGRERLAAESAESAGESRHCSEAMSIMYSSEDGYYVWRRREDAENMSRINSNYTRHHLQGASFDDTYEINGAGAPFERLFFQARDALNEVAENLAYERKDRDYERACHVEWEDFDCIEALIYTEQDLSQARRELEHTQDEISVLRMEVQELKESLSVCRSSSAAAPPLHPPLSPTPPTLLPFTGTAGAAGPIVRVAAGAAGPAGPGVGGRDKNT